MKRIEGTVNVVNQPTPGFTDDAPKKRKYPLWFMKLK